jgi:hypothetical protein
MTVGDASVRIHGLFCTSFLQERLHDLANSVTLFLSIFPPDIGKFLGRKTSCSDYPIL